MAPVEPNKLTLEILKIDERIAKIERYIIDGQILKGKLNDTMTEINTRTANLELMIHGDSTKIDRYTRDGINRRVEWLEGREKDADRKRGDLLKVAIGSITLAVGAFVLWLFQLIWRNIGK
jgi:hypothetical protein